MLTFAPGQVFPVALPFSNGSTIKLRPAAIVGLLSAWQGDQDCVVCPITLRSRRRYDVRIDWKSANLQRSSCVRPRPATISKKPLTHFVGELSAKDLDAVKQRLAEVLDP